MLPTLLLYTHLNVKVLTIGFNGLFHLSLQVFQDNPIHDEYIVVKPSGTNNTCKESPYGHPNTALLHTVILFSTFGIAIGLRLFQETRYFSPPVCIEYFQYTLISNFGTNDN